MVLGRLKLFSILNSYSTQSNTSQQMLEETALYCYTWRRFFIFGYLKWSYRLFQKHPVCTSNYNFELSVTAEFQTFRKKLLPLTSG